MIDQMVEVKARGNFLWRWASKSKLNNAHLSNSNTWVNRLENKKMNEIQEYIMKGHRWLFIIGEKNHRKLCVLLFHVSKVVRE